MILISANPTTRPRKRKAATKKGKKPMAKKHRSAAQRAATKRMLAANRRHRNPSSPKRHYKRVRHNPSYHSKRRVRRNPSFLGNKGGILKELISMDGALMIAGAFAAPLAADYIQETLMPSATGWTKIGIKAAIIAAGAYAIDKFLHKRKAALAFGVTGAAVLTADAVTLWKTPAVASTTGTSGMALNMAQNPAYAQGLAGFSSVGLADGPWRPTW